FRLRQVCLDNGPRLLHRVAEHSGVKSTASYVCDRKLRPGGRKSGIARNDLFQHLGRLGHRPYRLRPQQRPRTQKAVVVITLAAPATLTYIERRLVKSGRWCGYGPGPDLAEVSAALGGMTQPRGRYPPGWRRCR